MSGSEPHRAGHGAGAIAHLVSKFGAGHQRANASASSAGAQEQFIVGNDGAYRGAAPGQVQRRDAARSSWRNARFAVS